MEGIHYEQKLNRAADLFSLSYSLCWLEIEGVAESYRRKVRNKMV